MPPKIYYYYLLFLLLLVFFFFFFFCLFYSNLIKLEKVCFSLFKDHTYFCEEDEREMERGKKYRFHSDIFCMEIDHFWSIEISFQNETLAHAPFDA